MDMDLNDSVQMRLSSLFQTFRVIFYRAIVIIAKVIRDTIGKLELLQLSLAFTQRGGHVGAGGSIPA